MPAFGFLLILVGIFILINVINGNLVNLATGKLQFNFTPLPKTTSSITSDKPDLTQTKPNYG